MSVIRECPDSTALCGVPALESLLPRFRDLVGTAIVNVGRAERILESIEHGPGPAVQEKAEDYYMAGLEDIYRVLRDAIYAIENSLVHIEEKLGK